MTPVLGAGGERGKMALSDMATGDAFETVAVTWSQPECAVMLSMFEFYGIPAYATGRWHASVMPPLIMGLDGFHVRVHPDAVDDALDLLAEVAEQPAATRPYLLDKRWLRAVWSVLGAFLAAGPPTRTASTFFLWKRRV